MLNPAMKNGFPYAALRRFDNETHRIDGVMNHGLFNKRYLGIEVDDALAIAEQVDV